GRQWRRTLELADRTGPARQPQPADAVRDRAAGPGGRSAACRRRGGRGPQSGRVAAPRDRSRRPGRFAPATREARARLRAARLTIAAWRNEGRTRAESLLRDQAGEPVHGGTFTFGGQAFRIADGAFSPRRSREEHRLVGLDLDARFGSGWHWRASASRYAFA